MTKSKLQSFVEGTSTDRGDAKKWLSKLHEDKTHLPLRAEEIEELKGIVHIDSRGNFSTGELKTASRAFDTRARDLTTFRNSLEELKSRGGSPSEIRKLQTTVDRMERELGRDARRMSKLIERVDKLVTRADMAGFKDYQALEEEINEWSREAILKQEEKISTEHATPTGEAGAVDTAKIKAAEKQIKDIERNTATALEGLYDSRQRTLELRGSIDEVKTEFKATVQEATGKSLEELTAKSGFAAKVESGAKAAETTAKEAGGIFKGTGAKVALGAVAALGIGWALGLFGGNGNKQQGAPAR